jgi:hypothetical protein
MADLIHEFSYRVLDEKGTPFTARVYAQPARDDLWEGWIEFTDPKGRTLRTERETTQSRREFVLYWATGLEPIYLDGALERARALVSR